MTDSTDKTEEASQSDQIQVNRMVPEQIAYWAKELNVTPQKLEDVMDRVGTVVDDIRMELSATPK